MTKRKLRFNAVDVLLILFLAAVLFVIAYIFVFSDSKNETAAVTHTNIQYVVEIQNVDEIYSDIVMSGQTVQDAIERRSIGTVAGVQVSPFEKKTFNYTDGREAVSVVENKVKLRVTIDAQAVETSRAFTVDGREIRVGEQYSLMFPDFYGTGYCIEIIDKK